MQLAEQGKLDIDRPLQTYLPEFSVRSRFTGSGPITIRGLLTHHSGLPSNILKGMWNGNPEPYTNVVKLIREEYVGDIRRMLCSRIPMWERPWSAMWWNG